jgi:F-type H+-transporting ATPase subunit a
MTYFDPLEQFSIELIREYYNTGLDIPYVTIGKMIFLNLILILLAINGVKSIFASNIAQKLFRLLFKLVCKISKGSLDIKKHSFVVLLYLVFLFIFTSNILGLLPYSITVTSHLILTLFFSLAFFIGNNLIGLCYHKQKYFALFLPTGVPVLIIPFLILVEYVSYISRIFSLAIRLFANMMSGHILLKILISFV